MLAHVAIRWHTLVIRRRRYIQVDVRGQLFAVSAHLRVVAERGRQGAVLLRGHFLQLRGIHTQAAHYRRHPRFLGQEESLEAGVLHAHPATQRTRRQVR